MNMAPSTMPTPRLRVSDKVIQTFDYACLMRDFEAAERLLPLLKFLADRRPRRFGADRRTRGIDIEAAQQRLQNAREAAPV